MGHFGKNKNLYLIKIIYMLIMKDHSLFKPDNGLMYFTYL